MNSDKSQEVEKIIKKRKLDNETKEWSDELDTALPIKGTDIPNFKAWINWNGFTYNRKTKEGHDGFDFATYLTTDNRIIFGLPESVPIRAVADGVVRQISQRNGPYAFYINIEHGADDSGMFSGYHHVVPHIEQGSRVKKGDVIATLHKDPGVEEGRLVHLHLTLTSGWGAHGSSQYGSNLSERLEDPKLVDADIYRFSATPQGSANFQVQNLQNTKTELAHFKQVNVN